MRAILLILATAVGVAAWAQDGAEAGGAAGEDESWAEAIELPKEAKEMRDLGVPSDEVRAALQAARKRGMKGKEAREMMFEARLAAAENGPVNNFGAFVQARLDEGLRGKELAAAVREEHKARGVGKGNRPEQRPPAAGDRPGAPDGAERDRPGMDKAKAKAKAKAKEGGE